MKRHVNNAWITTSFRNLSKIVVASGECGRPLCRMRRRGGAPGLEALENRVVLSGAGGGSLLGSLSYAGVVTSPVIVPAETTIPRLPGTSTTVSSELTQLNTDVQALLNDLQTLAAKSGVTIADLELLTTDSQSIAQRGLHFSSQTLNPVISELATAVAGGTAPCAGSELFHGAVP